MERGFAGSTRELLSVHICSLKPSSPGKEDTFCVLPFCLLFFMLSHMRLLPQRPLLVTPAGNGHRPRWTYEPLLNFWGKTRKSFVFSCSIVLCFSLLVLTIHTHTHAHTTRAHMHTNMQHTRTHGHTQAGTCKHMHMHTCRHTHTYTNMHLHTNTHAHRL